MYDFPRNPSHNEALTVGDVEQDVPFTVYENGQTVTEGVFKGSTEYGLEGWASVPVDIGGKIEELDLYAAGIARLPYGSKLGGNGWAPAFTLPRSLES